MTATAQPLVGAPLELRLSRWLERHPGSPALIALPLFPLLFLGYGTDIDATGVRASGASILAGDYRYSRPPGSLPYEALAGALDRVGGAFAVNAASLAMAVAVLLLLVRLLRRARREHAVLAAAAFAGNPLFLIAATSLADHLWAIGFVLGGIDLHQTRRRWSAAVCFGLAIGIRGSSVVLVAAYLAAVLWDRGRTQWRSCLVVAALSAAVGAACFLPAWLSVDRSAAFLHNQVEFSGWVTAAGRWAVKQVLFLGFPAVVVLLAGTRVLRAGVRRWRASELVRFAIVGGLLSEAVYLRFPWKLAHLLPVLLCLVILLASSPRVTARFLLAFAAAQLLWGLLAVRTVVPDVRDAAQDARFSPAIVAGPLVTDVRCRAGAQSPPPAAADGEMPHPWSVEQWDCTNSWWRN